MVAGCSLDDAATLTPRRDCRSALALPSQTRQDMRVGTITPPGPSSQSRVAHSRLRRRGSLAVVVAALVVSVVLLLGHVLDSGGTPRVDTGVRLPVVAADGQSGWVARNGFVEPATYSGHALVFAQRTGHQVIGWYYPRCGLPSGLVQVDVTLKSCPATTATTVDG
jgi:hypothetical protein